MFIKLGVILFVLEVSAGQSANQEWDLAVAVSGQIKILNFNGTSIDAATPELQKLKAITYDYKRKQFLASETYNKNDTIYSLQLSKETDVTPLIKDLPDDIQGIAVDPINDVFYWTDKITKTIKYKSLKDGNTTSKILFQFENEKPQDIVVDSCNRKLYWTNSEMEKATIDSATLDGKNHTILVQKGLFMPMGIALDQARQKLYWAEVKSGIYFSIGSINLDGTDRRTILSGTHQRPFGLAVDGDYLYWTDITSQALWRKNLEDSSQFETIVSFKEPPYGLVTRNMGFSAEPDCSKLGQVVPKSNDVLTYKDKTCTSCLNNGNLTKDCNCICPLGFIGDRCETSVCPTNYCVHGKCLPMSSGSPRCYCAAGYIGKKCEKNLCDSYCLNGGLCTYQYDDAECACLHGYTGNRCEVPSSLNLSESNDYECKDGSASCSNMNGTKSSKLIRLTWNEFLSQDGVTRFQDPLFNVLLCAIVVLGFAIISLISYLKVTKRTRVKKRIIVNKNITPLSCAPQPITQCEITIENCCNMNLCETPCFEPPNVINFSGSEKDEKKTLLLNMEHNGDDLY